MLETYSNWDMTFRLWMTRVFEDVAFPFRSLPCLNEFCKFWRKTLHEKYLYPEFFWSVFSFIRTEYGDTD